MPAPQHSVFLEAECPSCHPTNSTKALKEAVNNNATLGNRYFLWGKN